MEWMLMPYRRYANFSGRSRRLEYWMFHLFFWIVFVGLFIVGAILQTLANGDPGKENVGEPPDACGQVPCAPGFGGV